MLTRVWAIALNTYRESIRSKIIYTMLVFAILLLLVSTFFGSVTLGDQIKVVKDFGFFLISLSSILYVSIAGSLLLSKELDRKTIYNILGKAVGRTEFILGKFLGMWLCSALLIAFMSAGLFAYCGLLDGGFDFIIFLCAIYLLCEMSIICAASIFFSSFVATPLLIGMFSLGLFFAGRSVSFLLEFLKVSDGNVVLDWITKLAYYLLPHLDAIGISDSLVYGKVPGFAHLALSVVYALGYSIVILSFASLLFKRRDFN